MTATNRGIVYDAVAILGFGESGGVPLPDAKSGEIVLRYGGWSLRELCANPVIREKNLMWEQDWYHTYEWSNENLPAGIYRLRVPVAASNGKTFAEQEQLLAQGEQTAQVVLVATAMLEHRLQAGENLLKNDFTRCREQTAGGRRVVLRWHEGRLYVDDDWGGDPGDGVWSSSVRTS